MRVEIDCRHENPNYNFWPAQYHGKIVTARVTNVVFDDATNWYCDDCHDDPFGSYNSSMKPIGSTPNTNKDSNITVNLDGGNNLSKSDLELMELRIKQAIDNSRPDAISEKEWEEVTKTISDGYVYKLTRRLRDESSGRGSDEHCRPSKGRDQERESEGSDRRAEEVA